MTKEEFVDAMVGKLKEIEKLFVNKNDQYATDDPYANFTAAARMFIGKADLEDKYEALRWAVSKHLAHYANCKIDGNKLDESLMDIAVYMLIASVMVDEYKAEQNTINFGR